MKSWVSILLSISFSVAGQTATKHSADTEPSNHFRWSERTAHELDYAHTLRNAADLTNEERQAIFKFIFHEFKSDADGAADDMPVSEIRRFVLSTRVEPTDLTGDGTRDVIAQAYGLPLCGGTGNCSWWFFEFQGGSMKVLLDNGRFGNGSEVITIRPWRIDGYNEIVLASHVSASERELVTYKYKEGSYRQAMCYWLSWIGDSGQALTSPEIFSIKCNNSFSARAKGNDQDNVR